MGRGEEAELWEGLVLCEGDLGLLWSYSTISPWYLKLIGQRNELSCPHPRSKSSAEPQSAWSHDANWDLEYSHFFSTDGSFAVH